MGSLAANCLDGHGLHSAVEQTAWMLAFPTISPNPPPQWHGSRRIPPSCVARGERPLDGPWRDEHLGGAAWGTTMGGTAWGTTMGGDGLGRHHWGTLEGGLWRGTLEGGTLEGGTLEGGTLEGGTGFPGIPFQWPIECCRIPFYTKHRPPPIVNSPLSSPSILTKYVSFFCSSNIQLIHQTTRILFSSPTPTHLYLRSPSQNAF